MSHYDKYGTMATDETVSDIIQNGRYEAQKTAELLIPADVVSKLKFNGNDEFLDIGCGLGLNLDVGSNIVQRAVGCDHPYVIEKLKRKFTNINADLVGGNFLELTFEKRFTKILAYSVLPALPDIQTVNKFIDKVISLLSPSGMALLGDLANIDKKNRFLASSRGKLFQLEWNKSMIDSQIDKESSDYQTKRETKSVIMDDDIILGLAARIRKKDFNAYILDQPQNLPFGNTREDILIVGPEFDSGAR